MYKFKLWKKITPIKFYSLKKKLANLKVQMTTKITNSKIN